MAKPRLTFEQIKARGADQVNPGRFTERKNAPVATGELGDPPKYLKAPVKKIWKELVARIPHGVAGDTDCYVVEIAACLLHEFRTDPTSMPASRIARLTDMLSKLGLDPQARTKLQVPAKAQPVKQDALSKYMDALTHDTSETVQ